MVTKVEECSGHTGDVCKDECSQVPSHVLDSPPPQTRVRSMLAVLKRYWTPKLMEKTLTFGPSLRIKERTDRVTKELDSVQSRVSLPHSPISTPNPSSVHPKSGSELGSLGVKGVNILLPFPEIEQNECHITVS